jgi:glycosyltransferase 2 family protein
MSAAVQGPSTAAGRRLSVWLLAAVAIYLGLTWLFGGADTLQAARRIGGGWIAFGLLLTTASFAIRVLRWHFLLRTLRARVPFAVNGAVYLAGIALSATPGKIGETVRSAFLLPYGVPVGASLAAFLADRLSDLHAVLLIALLPLAWAAGWSEPGVLRWTVVLAAVGVAPFGLAVMVRSRRWHMLLLAVPRIKPLLRFADWLQRGASDFSELWQPRTALLSIAASLLAYGLQAAIFACMVAQVAPQVSFITSCWIFAAATLAGAASFIPGGIGAMELTLVVLLRQQGVDGASALAAALCLRAVTFWFGLVLGAAGLSAAVRLQRG